MKNFCISICLFAAVFLAATSTAAGLACGKGAMSPMEARLARQSGDNPSESSRISNAQRAARKLKSSVPNATSAPSGTKTSYVTVKKGCCKCKQTISASGGAKVGVGATKAQAEAAARSPKSGSKVTW